MLPMKKFNLTTSIVVFVFLFISISGCKEKPAGTANVTEAQSQVLDENPAMEGFNKSESDEKGMGFLWGQKTLLG